ncbi:hypothetical protein BS78_02G348000 [Paspalum vaginatum]|nr:hypothetical protein BS78_02G348000 [Paspalum vaginatum]
MDGTSARSPSRSPRGRGPSHGGTEMALPQVQLLPWLDGDGLLKAVAADGESGCTAGSAATASKTGKRRYAARDGLARGMRVLLSGVAEMVGKRFERSIPAAKFGHVAYIR